MDRPRPGPPNLDDARYPAYSMGRAAALLGVQPAFLRGLDSAGLLQPDRSSGGHRRYSREELGLAARVREVVDEGFTLAAACRIASLEHQLEQAQLLIEHLQRAAPSPKPAPGTRRRTES